MAPAQPNLLIFVVDQLSGTLWPDGPAPFLRAPNLRALAQRSLRFRNAHTPSPLCAPSRASLMTGQLPSKTGVYDNAALFPADIPTYAHYLRRAGYQTCLAGKMHFVGPDQLHGFEERLTTDIYPADFGWTPDWEHPSERIDWWYHNMDSVRAAGVADITNQLGYDDEVAYHAGRKLLSSRIVEGAACRPRFARLEMLKQRSATKNSRNLERPLRVDSRRRRSLKTPRFFFPNPRMWNS